MIIKQQLCPESGVQFTNTEFSKTTFVEDTFDDPPESNKGLFAIVSLPPHTVIGIYEGGESLKASTVTSSRYKSDYAVQYQHLIRDGYDRQKGEVTCHPARINDSLDKERDNCEFYIHPDHSHLLLVISTQAIAAGEQLFLPYGPDYWCQDQFSLNTLAAAVRRYDIDIKASPQWRRLKKFKDLCKLLDSQQQHSDLKHHMNKRTTTNTSDNRKVRATRHTAKATSPNKTRRQLKLSFKTQDTVGPVQLQLNDTVSTKPELTSTILTAIEPATSTNPSAIGKVLNSELKDMILIDTTPTVTPLINELQNPDTSQHGHDVQTIALNSKKRKDHPSFVITSTKIRRQFLGMHDLQQKDNTQEVNTSDHHQETEIHLDTTQRHEDDKDKETTPDYQDTASAVYVHSVNSTYDVDVVSKKSLDPLHTQARTSPTHPGAPSSTCFDKHLVDS